MGRNPSFRSWNQSGVAIVASYNATAIGMLIDALYLREKAHYCAALARKCTDITTARALEALSIELMEKAAELEQGRSLIGGPYEKQAE
jgi:hypothetical protein